MATSAFKTTTNKINGPRSESWAKSGQVVEFLGRGHPVCTYWCRLKVLRLARPIAGIGLLRSGAVFCNLGEQLFYISLGNSVTSLRIGRLVWTKLLDILRAFDCGVLIRGKDGLWLAIPPPAAGLTGLRRAKGLLAELVRRAEVSEEVELTRHGNAAVKLAQVSKATSTKDRRAAMEEALHSAK